MKSNSETEYLTMREAAKFCGVSYEHFCRNRASHGIAGIYFMGKRLFRKTDLVDAIEKMAPDR